jgi:NPCBM/NEW2 domain
MMRKLIATSTIAMGLATLPISAAHADSTWIVGIEASATTVNVGHKVTFTGTVRPRAAAAGEKVLLQERFKPGAEWKTQKAVKTSARGKYSVTDRPTLNTRHAYRVVMPATKKHAKGVSATVKLRVYAWQYLSDRQAVNGYMHVGTVNINGTSYKHSVYASYSSSSYLEYNLDHRCIKARATFGISDGSTTGGQATVDVLSDGSNVYAHTFDVGQKEAKTVALAKPLKLRLESTSTGDAGTTGLGAFASAQVLCSQ